MRKSVKILIVIAAIAVAGTCIFAGYSAVTRGDDTQTTTTSPAQEQTSGTATTEPVTAETTTNKQPTLGELLIGKWTDSAGMSGFEFFSDGKVSFTYANLEALGIPFDGKVDNGTYKLKDSTLTVAYSIYTATIEKKYSITIEDDVLKMKNLEEGDTSTYIRGESQNSPATTNPTTTEAQTSVSDELLGSWENTSMSKKYKFSGDGTVVVTLDGENFKGVYVTENTSVMIQYTAYGKKITEKFLFSVTRTSLSLTNDKGSVFVFSRAGTEINEAEDKDLLGVWRDSANMSGYEFKENGVVVITFVNITLPVVDFPINGSYTGGYEIDGDEVTLTYYLYGNEISDTYEYEVETNSLRLKNTKNGNVSMYVKQ